MNTTINYTSMTKKNFKESKKMNSLIEFISKEFNVKGKRLGIPNFVKKFGKFNDEKATLEASSVPTITDITVVCREISKLIIADKSSDVIPVVNSSNGVVTIETRDASEFSTYYPTLKDNKKAPIDPTKFIINYIQKHIEEIDVKTILQTLQNL